MSPESPTADPWLDLERGCAAALVASREILFGLESGATGTDLVPLLQRECDAVETVRGLLPAVQAAPGTDASARRDAALRQLALLMETDERSRALLTRRGLQLRPRPRRRGR